jgi:hypothetical protein
MNSYTPGNSPVDESEQKEYQELLAKAWGISMEEFASSDPEQQAQWLNVLRSEHYVLSMRDASSTGWANALGLSERAIAL